AVLAGRPITLCRAELAQPRRGIEGREAAEACGGARTKDAGAVTGHRDARMTCRAPCIGLWSPAVLVHIPRLRAPRGQAKLRVRDDSVVQQNQSGCDATL